MPLIRLSDRLGRRLCIFVAGHRAEMFAPQLESLTHLLEATAGVTHVHAADRRCGGTIEDVPHDRSLRAKLHHTDRGGSPQVFGPPVRDTG